MSQKHKFSTPYQPERCWVGDQHKVCYPTEYEAEVAARCAEYDYHATGLSVYKCEYGNHWHISSGHRR